MMFKSRIPKSKILIFMFCFVFVVFALGCATYKIQESPKYGGYVYSRSANIIPEYTTDDKNKAPEGKDLAKERFKRRCKKVESYYRSMGYIQGVSSSYWQYIRIFLFSPLISPMVIPIHLVQQHKYNYNPKYRAMIDKIEDAEEENRRQKVKDLQKELLEYIKNDTASEKSKDLDSTKEVAKWQNEAD